MFAVSSIAGIVRTDATGTQRGIRVAWSDLPGTQTSVRWQRDGGPWRDEPLTELFALALVPAEPGHYRFEFLTQRPGRTLRREASREFTFAAERALPSLAVPKPSGFELVGPEGELIGQPVAVTLRDLRLRWTAIRADALASEALGELPPEGLLEFAELRVVAPSGDVVRVEQIPIGRSDHVYTYADAGEDFPITTPSSATISVRLELRHKDVAGRVSQPAVIETAWTRRLSATGDLELEAVTEFAVLEDDTEIDLTATVNGDPQVLETLVVPGPPVGSSLLVRASDRIVDFGLTFNSSSNLVLRYRLRLFDSGSPATLIAEARQQCLYFIDSGSQILTAYAQDPTLELIADGLTPGEPYTIELSWDHVSFGGGSDGFFASTTTSGQRFIMAQVVKR